MADIVNVMEKSDGRERAMYSVHFDRWLEAITNGNDKAADAEWAAVLKETRGPGALDFLMTNTATRIHFMSDEDRARIIARGGLKHVYGIMLSSTEKHLGKNHLYVASIKGYLGERSYESRQWTEAARYAQSSLSIQERAWGKSSPKLAHRLLCLSAAQFQMKSYDDAKANALRAMQVSEKGQNARNVKRAKSILRQIERATARVPSR